MNGKLTVISTFSGCGGSSLGYKLAGFKELLAIDFDTNSIETFKLNFPEIPVWQKDITKVKAQEIIDFCKIKIGELDILDGSPPCQGFSTAGKRQVLDPRNELFKSFVYLIHELQPKVFIMENVQGQIKGKMKGLFKEILTTLKTENYKVKVKLMNTKFYQVPQSRPRLIYIGVRKDLIKEPSYPIPNMKIINVMEALKGVVNKTYAKEFTPNILELWNKMSPGEKGSKYKNGSYFNWIKISPNKPINTIAKKETGCLLHWKEKRFLTIEEAKRLCSFPDDFRFIGNYRQQWARLGNAVMPNFMKAIALNIKENIL
jgi:DNA (cytosine-5)-methyltransferase 1